MWQGQPMQQHMPSGMMQQVMQADRQDNYQQYGYGQNPTTSSYMQHQNYYYQTPMHSHSYSSPMIQQAMQADHPSRGQNRYTNYSHS